jgi:hypothetical protein
VTGPTIEYERPWLYDKQLEAIFCPERFALIEAGTKSGKTVGCLAWLVEQAVLDGGPHKHYWWVAPVIRQANIFWRRLQAGLPPQFQYDKNETEKWIKLPNQATIWALSAERPDNLFGEDVYAAVIDEASRVRTDSWHAVRSTLTATRGPIRCIGNVKGKKNWFYHLARLAESGSPGMRYSRITCWDAIDAGVIELEEVEQARGILPEAIFKELYEAEPGDDGGNPFGMDHITSCVFLDDNGLPTQALPDTKPFVWGWDLAKAMNYTVGIALDRDGQVCRFERFQLPWEETFNRIIFATGRAPALVDETPGSAGDPLLERLRASGRYNFQGFKFNASSKQALMIGLAAAIQRREISYPAGTIVEELESFEYRYSVDRPEYVLYRASEGMHDDSVDALALAVYHRSACSSTQAAAVPFGATRPSHWTRI